MYKIAAHTAYFSSSGEDMKKQFDLVKQLSKGFTVKNSVALELDAMLMEFKKLDDGESQPEATEQKKPQKTKARQTSLEDSFTELFEAVRNSSLSIKQGAPLNKESLKEALHETLKEVKIRYGDLDNEVQKRFSTLPITLKYELPQRSLPSFTKPPIGEFQHMVDDLMLGNNVFLIGGAGTGKTFTAEQLISKSALGRQHITINCSQWTSPTEIIGGQTMDGYVEGKLIEAWKNGWVLILDELPKIDPNTAGLFNDALSKTKLDKAVIFNARKESFVKHPDFACIATGNIYPDKESMSYGANNKQDLSLLDRFSGSVYFVEKNPAIERQIIQNDMLWSICDRLRSAIEELKYEAQLSLRFMQTARDAYELEMLRLKSKKTNSINANEGKTFKSSLESFLSPFTSVQQKNLKERIHYDRLLSTYQYRELNPDDLIA